MRGKLCQLTLTARIQPLVHAGWSLTKCIALIHVPILALDVVLHLTASFDSAAGSSRAGISIPRQAHHALEFRFRDRLITSPELAVSRCESQIRWTHLMCVGDIRWYIRNRSGGVSYLMLRHSSTGMERLQSSMERIWVRRSKRPTHYPQQAMEAWRSYVQQVTSLETYFKYPLCLWRIIFTFGRHFLAMSVYSLHIIAACFLSCEWWYEETNVFNVSVAEYFRVLCVCHYVSYKFH